MIFRYKDKSGVMWIRVRYFSQIPTTMGVEKAINPLLRRHSLEIRINLRISLLACDLESFAIIRQAKDCFKVEEAFSPVFKEIMEKKTWVTIFPGWKKMPGHMGA